MLVGFWIAAILTGMKWYLIVVLTSIYLIREADDIKKKWKEYIEELYKKDLHNPDDHKGVITHLEPDILECEVK